MKNGKKFLLTILMLMATILSVNSISAADIPVNPGDDIQTAVDGANPGDNIVVNDNNGVPATYNTNIKINKTNLTLRANGSVTLNAADNGESVIKIVNDGGSDNGSQTTIIGFKVTGTTGNTNSGIYISNVHDVQILNNEITNNYDGISIKGYSSVLVQGNNIHDNTHDGIVYQISQINGLLTSTTTSNQVKILENNILRNGRNGITIYEYYFNGNTLETVSTAPIIPISINTFINFNRITGNTNYGLSYILVNPIIDILANTNGDSTYKVDATNNWWGLDNILDVSTQINDTNNYVDWVPFLVLIVSPNPVVINAGGSTLITADLTKNWNNEDTSALGHIPDGTPVFFTTSFGNLGSKTKWAYTVGGKATVLLLGNEGPGIAYITATVDGATEYANVPILAAGEPTVRGTIAMQPTGVPIVLFILALVMVVGGMVIQRK